jgi:hypothetical protein
MVEVTNSKHLFPHIGKICPYCHKIMTYAGKRRPSRDHIMPKSRGFNFSGGLNRTICCVKCNTSKGNHHPITWWSVLANGNDPRADFVFEFVRRRVESKSVTARTHVKANALEAFNKKLAGWVKPPVCIEDCNTNTVTRIGIDEIELSLTATWH